MRTDGGGPGANPTRRWPRALRSLRRRDLRLFFGGQAVSLAGTWMQTVAQAWLVWRLTRSSEMLGLVNFLGSVPVFLFGIWAGRSPTASRAAGSSSSRRRTPSCRRRCSPG